MPARTLSRVDLPVPLPPTRPVRSSGVMSQLASSKRSFWPKRLPAAESWSISFYFRISSGWEEVDGRFIASKDVMENGNLKEEYVQHGDADENSVSKGEAQRGKRRSV